MDPDWRFQPAMLPEGIYQRVFHQFLDSCEKKEISHFPSKKKNYQKLGGNAGKCDLQIMVPQSSP